MYRIKHIATDLYYQPHKHRGNHLSKKGKVYHNKSTAERVLNMISTISLSSSSIVYKIASKVLEFKKSKSSYEQVTTETSKDDWEIVEV